MSYDENEEELEDGFKVGGDIGEDDILDDMPDMDFGLDEEDPDKDN